MRSFRTSRTFDILFLASVIGILAAAFYYRVALGDWVFFSTHQPTQRTINLAKSANLTPEATRLLYRGNPQFVDSNDITLLCAADELGCLTSNGQIYVLDDPDNPDQSIVTAVHEMLHLAYSRLSESEKAGLAYDLTQQLQLPDIQTQLRSYSSANERLDEVHSILGTEYPSLPTSLESYYRAYFTNRQQMVDIYTASQK